MDLEHAGWGMLLKSVGIYSRNSLGLFRKMKILWWRILIQLITSRLCNIISSFRPFPSPKVLNFALNIPLIFHKAKFVQFSGDALRQSCSRSIWVVLCLAYNQPLLEIRCQNLLQQTQRRKEETLWWRLKNIFFITFLLPRLISSTRKWREKRVTRIEYFMHSFLHFTFFLRHMQRRRMKFLSQYYEYSNMK